MGLPGSLLMPSWAAVVLLCDLVGSSPASQPASGNGPAVGGEVPLALWTDATWPDGLPIGETNGISWGDFDADGYIDLFACQSGHLWRNLAGASWELAADLDSVLPAAAARYGASFGDYDGDGLPDIGTEPRGGALGGGEPGDKKLHLLNNLGGGPNFADVAGDRAIVDLQPFGPSETLCWGDVNDDGNLDLFLPVYPAPQGEGNFFLFNLGPSGPGGAHRFTEASGPAGLDNPPGTAQPEGAQFVDADFDGDLDLYSNGTLYQNRSTPDTPAFEPLSESAAGIGLRAAKDEGALFFDYDLDGDYDLFVAYVFDGIKIWEAYGDGTFVERTGIIDQPMTGLGLGISAEDWDNDGDIDFTTREVFRRNRLIEDGERHFTVAVHSLPSAHLASATPAWGDWDRDGDLDCALGNWSDEGHFYENTLYSAITPQDQRRTLRVRALGSSAAAPQGLENQYGASVEVHLLDGPDGLTRRKFVASSHGYLNQNEYALSFGLPADPSPANPAEDLHFDLTIDFPSLPSAGVWRVDRHVNPALGGIDLADLSDREIRVHRCGEATIDGVLHEPPPLVSARLTTTTGGLALPTATVPLAPPVVAESPASFVGLSFNTLGAVDRVRVKEIILDGSLGAPAACGAGAFNLAFWDVTDPLAPSIVPGGGIEASPAGDNRRSYYRTDVVLDPGRSYRLVARVETYRATSIAAPIDHGPIEVTGGLLYEDPDPCTGQVAATTPESASETFLALRFDPAGIASEEPDPVGDTLTLSRQGTQAVLHWPDVPQAAAYEVLRCSAEAGPCVPQTLLTTIEAPYVDGDVTSDHVWYEIRAARTCGSELSLP